MTAKMDCHARACQFAFALHLPFNSQASGRHLFVQASQGVLEIAF